VCLLFTETSSLSCARARANAHARVRELMQLAGRLNHISRRAKSPRFIARVSTSINRDDVSILPRDPFVSRYRPAGNLRTLT